MNIGLQPKQRQLYNYLRATGRGIPTIIGFGGARGGAKSGGIRRAMVLRRLDNPGTVGFIVRRYFSDLAENHIEKFRLEFPELAAYWREGDKEYRFPNKSRIAFLYGENKEAVRSISRGPECMDLMVDQAEEFTEEELTMLRECNRWPAAAAGSAKSSFYFNPGGPGTEYLRRVFWKREFRSNESPEDYTFIQAYGWDNYEWFRGEVDLSPGAFYDLPNDERFELFIHHTTYGRKMDALPAALRIGELLGSFDHFSGQYYAGVWDENTCVLGVSEAEALIQPWWTRWIAQDWGFAHHNCNLWFAAGKLSPAQALSLGIVSDWPIDVVIVHRELVISDTGEQDLAREIVRLTPESERKMVRAYYLGPDAWAKRGAANSAADQIGAILTKNGLPEPQPADNSRTSSGEDQIGGWRLLFNGFQRNRWRSGAVVEREAAQSGPMLLISAACPQVISAIPLLIRDEDDLENVLKTNTVGDDVCLAPGTIITTERGAIPIEEVRPGDRVLTRYGYFPVVAAEMTCEHATRITMEFCAGRLTGTPNHRVFREQGPFRLDSFRYGDKIIAWTGSCTKAGSMWRFLLAIIDARTDFFTARFGKTPTGRFLRAIISTTRTAIEVTTSFPIWSALTGLSTAPCTRNPENQTWNCLSAFARSRRRGIDLAKGGNGHGRTPSRPGSATERSVSSASSAERTTRGSAGASVQTPVSPNGAVWLAWTWLKERAADAVRCLRQTAMTKLGFAQEFVLGTTDATPGPVYNLTVDGPHEYFANGILVSNCDALRYGFKSYLNPKTRAPRAIRAQEVYDSAPTPSAKHLAMLKFQENERKRRLVTRQPRWR